MGIKAKQYTFSAGATIIAAEHNTNFDDLYNEFNGSIDNANIKSAAGIVDTKLAQITTAGKVSGAAITSLSSVPAGAGALPTANGGTGDSSTTYCNLAANVRGTLPIANGGTGGSTTGTAYTNLVGPRIYLSSFTQLNSGVNIVVTHSLGLDSGSNAMITIYGATSVAGTDARILPQDVGGNIGVTCRNMSPSSFNLQVGSAGAGGLDDNGQSTAHSYPFIRVVVLALD